MNHEDDNKSVKRPSILSLLARNKKEDNIDSNEKKEERRGTFFNAIGRLSIKLLGKNSVNSTVKNDQLIVNEKEDTDVRPFVLAYLGRYNELLFEIQTDKTLINQKFNILPVKKKYPSNFIKPPNILSNIRKALKDCINRTNLTDEQHYLLYECFGNSSLLHYACINNQVQIVNLLLSNDININIVNNSKRAADFYTDNDDIHTIIWSHKLRSNTCKTNRIDEQTTSNSDKKKDFPNKRASKRMSRQFQKSDKGSIKMADLLALMAAVEDKVQIESKFDEIADSKSNANVSIEPDIRAQIENKFSEISDSLNLTKTLTKSDVKLEKNVSLQNVNSTKNSSENEFMDHGINDISRINSYQREPPIVLATASVKNYSTVIEPFESNIKTNYQFDDKDSIVSKSNNAKNKLSAEVDMYQSDECIENLVKNDNVKVDDTSAKKLTLKGRTIGRMSILRVYNAMVPTNLPKFLDNDNSESINSSNKREKFKSKNELNNRSIDGLLNNTDFNDNNNRNNNFDECSYTDIYRGNTTTINKISKVITNKEMIWRRLKLHINAYQQNRDDDDIIKLRDDGKKLGKGILIRDYGSYANKNLSEWEGLNLSSSFKKLTEIKPIDNKNKICKNIKKRLSYSSKRKWTVNDKSIKGWSLAYTSDINRDFILDAK